MSSPKNMQPYNWNDFTRKSLIQIVANWELNAKKQQEHSYNWEDFTKKSLVAIITNWECIFKDEELKKCRKGKWGDWYCKEALIRYMNLNKVYVPYVSPTDEQAVNDDHYKLARIMLESRLKQTEHNAKYRIKESELRAQQIVREAASRVRHAEGLAKKAEARCVRAKAEATTMYNMLKTVAESGRMLQCPPNIVDQVYRSDNKPTCCICLEQLDRDDFVLSTCGHHYCKADYDKVTQCSVCRLDLCKNIASIFA